MVEWEQVYSVDVSPVVARGLAHKNGFDHWKDALASLIRDEEGKRGIAELLAGIASTQFETEGLSALLEKVPACEIWRAGEATGEKYLADHHGCEFPWPPSRDLRNFSASPAGADLVGFQRRGAGKRFAFGEVKTSHEAKWPPSLMSGRAGLIKQLEHLRDSEAAKRELVLYLGHRARNSEFSADYRVATAAFLKDHNDVALFGILIREVQPSADDLQARAAALAKGCSLSASIHLLALYLEEGFLRDVVVLVDSPQEGPS